ncbi:hypothetical protein B0O80DRAFT_428601 [Mortierella sp. GBAus27b]|nr:hypothetical protein B0O80DRAFT_428601 [Mortierella sp. GBAus27b]
MTPSRKFPKSTTETADETPTTVEDASRHPPSTFIHNLHYFTNNLHSFTNNLHYFTNNLHSFTNNFHYFTNNLHSFTDNFHYFTNNLHSFTNNLHSFTNNLHSFTNNFHYFINSNSNSTMNATRRPPKPTTETADETPATVEGTVIDVQDVTAQQGQRN